MFTNDPFAKNINIIIDVVVVVVFLIVVVDDVIVVYILFITLQYLIDAF